MNTAIPLEMFDLMVAATLVLVAGVVSVMLRLGLEQRLLLASLRTVVQLLLIGYVLKWVFNINQPVPVILVMGLMIAAASHAAVQRPDRTFQGAVSMAFFVLTISGLITTFTVTSVIINVQPWYLPQYVIPLLGMVLGNALTGISLCLDQILEAFAEKKDAVEMELALGATAWEAARDTLKNGVTKGMIPIINSMTVVGIVALPGMMTGQILAGADPVSAVKYQIVVMFMIAAATSVGCLLTAVLLFQRLFNDQHQLEADRIIKQR